MNDSELQAALSYLDGRFRTYVVLYDRKDSKYYSTEIEGGESIMMAARRLVVYHEIDGPTQFIVYTAHAESCGTAADAVMYPNKFSNRHYKHQEAGMLYYNGPSN